ncbi:LuxR family transcriptional regulator [Frankia sp. CiP3]|uniref:helix-turn-helix transcriptional regulator n=1 Tax=Frankia sp. CiP3 TaxID=2880971 RepID=UPI001EF4CB68|nr:LuxR family transcriptional regulator [Frankia sp. CiP3]
MFRPCQEDTFGLVQREEEIGIITAAVRRSGSGGRNLSILLEGAPGYGKTSLLDAFVDEISRAGATVLSVVCSRSEKNLQFGVLRQMIQAVLPPDGMRSAYRRLEQSTLLAVLTEAGVDGVAATLIHENFVALAAALAAENPLVIVIDDVEFIDDSSADCLLYGIRRLRSSSVTLVLARSTATADEIPHVRELGRQARLQVVRLEPLSEESVRHVVAAYAVDDVDRLAYLCHQVSGGNPLLVQAVLQDHRLEKKSGRSFEAEHGEVGENLRRAVSLCLDGVPAEVRKVAEGIAVLGPNSSPTVLDRMLDIGAGRVHRSIGILTAINFLRDGLYRHENIRLAVLTGISAGWRAELHQRASEVLFEVGATPETLAHHIFEAHSTAPSWAVCVLRSSAVQAASAGDVERADKYLELAARDGRTYATTKAIQLELAWSRDPSIAARHASGLHRALCHGQIGVPEVISLAKYELWRGHVAEVTAVLAKLDDMVANMTEDIPSEVWLFRTWLSHAYPPLAAMLRLRPPEGGPEPGSRGHENDPCTTASDALLAVLTNRADDETFSNAVRVLRAEAEPELTNDTRHTALLSLVYADQLGDAAHYCDRLLRESEQGGAVTWHALQLGIRGEIFRRCGDLRAALRVGRAALAEVSQHSWGMAIGQPLASLLLTTLTLGLLQEAAELVEWAVPPALPQSGQGLLHGYASSFFHIASGDPEAAARGFLECGERAMVWGLDMPTFVPWRSGAAEAMLALGRPEQARRLLIDQINLLDERHLRLRGASLRLIAETVHGRERRRILTSAVELLSSSGDRLELARALHDLSCAERDAGDAACADVRRRAAVRMAEECGMTLPLSRYEDDQASGDGRRPDSLTNAEQRVALLAARGHTNREIASRLSITPSTVEQHLTRVFRKLRVKRRGDLPSDLIIAGQ